MATLTIIIDGIALNDLTFSQDSNNFYIQL